MKPPYTNWQKSLAVSLALLTAFAAGVWGERSGWLPGSVRQESAEMRSAFAAFWQSWNLVREHYVERDAIQPERMTRGAIEGMLSALGDTGHTAYLPPEDLHLMQEALAGRLEGIGARLTLRNNRPTVVSTLAGSPADKAGLLPGDVLSAVEGNEVTGLPLSRVLELLRGPLNSVVHLEVHREGHARPIDFSIVRSEITINDVTWQMLPADEPIAHIVIHKFGHEADQQLHEVLRQARRQSARGLIVDVRGNPGGLKNKAVAVTSEFLASGTVFIEKDARGNIRPVTVKPDGIATDLPLVVLIDEGTASSAEIFAAAIQDHERGQLVGTRTFGTGTILQPFVLPDGGALLLGVSQWLTPSGRQVWHRGIKPDVEVALAAEAAIVQPEANTQMTSATLSQSTDAQFLKAIQILSKK